MPDGRMMVAGNCAHEHFSLIQLQFSDCFRTARATLVQGLSRANGRRIRGPINL